VKGVVQGVAFRYHTKKRAEALGIFGYVKNLSNGNVEIVASSNPENLKLFEEFLKTGPSSAIVSSVDKAKSDFDLQMSDFKILF